MNKFNIYSPDGQFLVAAVNAQTINIAGNIITGTRDENELSFMLSPVGIVIDADQIVREIPTLPVGVRGVKTPEPIEAPCVYPTVYNPNSLDLTTILQVGDDVIAHGDKAKITSLEGEEVYIIETSVGQTYTRFGAYQKTQPNYARDLKPVGFNTWDEYVEAKKMNSVE